MSRFRAPAVAFTILLSSLLMAACQTTGPAGTPPPGGPPTDGPPGGGPPIDGPTGLISAIDPAAALPGERVTVTGEGFGTTGAATVGDAAAEIVSWSADTIELVVPEAQGGWQTLAVAPEGGGSGTAALFVGAETTPEAAADAQRFQEFLDALAPGTHVLLPAGELGLAGHELIIDGVHLHGHPDGTSIELGSGGVAVLVSQADSAGVYDLSVSGTYFDLRPTLSGGIVPLQFLHTDVSLERIEYSGTSFGAGSAGEAGGHADLKLEDSRILATGRAHLQFSGPLDIVDSELLANVIYLMSNGDSTAVTGSTLASQGTMSIAADVNIYMDGSKLSVADGNLHVTAYGSLGPNNFAPGQVMIERSELEANEVAANGTPDDESGEISISAVGGTVLLFDNERIQAVDEVRISATGRVGDPATVQLMDNGLIAAGLYPDGTPREVDTGVYVSVTGLDENVINVLDVLGNDIRSGRIIELRTGTERTNVSIGDNQMRAGVGGLNGRIRVITGSTGRLDVTNNELAASLALRLSTEWASGFNENVTFAGNTVTVSGAERPNLALVPKARTCSYTNNTVSVSGTGAGNFDVELSCFEPSEADPSWSEVSGNDVTVTGSQGRVVSESDGEMNITENSFAATTYRVIAYGPISRLERNDLQVGMVELRGAPSDLVFFDNDVTIVGSAASALLVDGSAALTVESNRVNRSGPSEDDMTVLTVDLSGVEADLRVNGNVFTGFTHALALEFDRSSVTGEFNQNHFDFPVNAAGKALRLTLTNASDVQLDLGENRWGDVTTPEELHPYLTVVHDPDSTGVITIESVLTD